ERIFAKLGTTVYRLRYFENSLRPNIFIPASQLTDLRRKLVEQLDNANIATYPFGYRKVENLDEPYIKERLDAEDNVANRLAEDFYRSHGAETEAKAIETCDDHVGAVIVMRTRYCLRRELGICKKNKNGSKAYKNACEPFFIQSGSIKFQLQFDCARCEMNVIAPEH
ncbi:MAG: DUF3656 domain-containing protein, partial [Muribaculaceae bacterium]|nr:DUF3656 domain-containing protein [Muribaculaceae bacterium]